MGRVLYRFDMIGSHQAGETRHPQTAIRAWFPDASDFEAAPIGDCWLFTADARTGVPGYFVLVEPQEAQGGSVLVDDNPVRIDRPVRWRRKTGG